jgi:DNA end-binding protein Ku
MKAYRLLVETMAATGLAAVIQFVWRGRENVAAMRAHEGTLVLHTRFFADEVRDAKEIGTPTAEVRDAELRLAKRLIDELRVNEFNPMKHHDAFRERLEQAAREKATLEMTEARPARAPVIDLMDALQKSLRKPSAKAAARAAAEAPTPAPVRRRSKRGAA